MIRISFFNIPDDTRYAFAVARIRALESRMLDHSLIVRLLKSAGINEMLKILMDTQYSISINEVGEVPFEYALDNELSKVYELIRSIDPDPEWTDMWRWRYDSHNIKVILKAGLSNKEALDYLIPYGMIEPPKILLILQEGDYECLPLPISEAVGRIVLADEGEKKRGSEIDFIIDQALYLYLSKEAQRSKNLFLIQLIGIFIDLINIKSFLRIKGIKASQDVFRDSFLQGGLFSKDCFLSHEEREPEEIVRNILENTYYEELKPYIDSRNLAAFETATENFLIAYLRQTRQRVFGVEPLIGYLLAKEMEIKNLRLIYICKANGLMEELIKERLCETYV